MWILILEPTKNRRRKRPTRQEKIDEMKRQKKEAYKRNKKKDL